jgi:LmbE family N-acetylglucosaminyl deacetylase
MKVELIYDADCPNVAAARSLLAAAFAQARIATRWLEWERNESESPAYARQFGSPTILVDGKDVAGAMPGAGDASCRVYRSAEGRLAGAPSPDHLLAALRAAGKPPVACEARGEA